MVKNTADHFALERFLHNELAEKRIREIQSESWYGVSPEEMDLAIQRGETLGLQHIARKKRVAEVKQAESDGTWLEPTERQREVYKRLSQIVVQENSLKHEKQILLFEVQASIGSSDGVDGLFAWPAHEQYRFQSKSFKKEYPDLFDSFCAPIYVRRFKLLGIAADDFEQIDE